VGSLPACMFRWQVASADAGSWMASSCAPLGARQPSPSGAGCRSGVSAGRARPQPRALSRRRPSGSPGRSATGGPDCQHRSQWPLPRRDDARASVRASAFSAAQNANTGEAGASAHGPGTATFTLPTAADRCKNRRRHTSCRSGNLRARARAALIFAKVPHAQRARNSTNQAW
jgi:hypothetical protein